MNLTSFRTKAVIAGVLVGGLTLCTGLTSEARSLTDRPPIMSIADQARQHFLAGRIFDLGPAASSTAVGFAVVLHGQNKSALQDLNLQMTDPKSPLFGHFLTKEQFNRSFAPTLAEEASVMASLRENGFTITQRYDNRFMLMARGPVSRIDALFSTRLRHITSDGVSIRTASFLSPLVPSSWQGLVDEVVGLDDLQPTESYVRKALYPAIVSPTVALKAKRSAIGGPGTGPNGGYGPSLLASSFDFPAEYGYTGSGQLLGIIDGEVYSPSDLTSYINYYGVPYSGHIRLNNVDGGGTFHPNDEFGQESNLDIQTVVGLAPAVNINFYSLPTSGSGASNVIAKSADIVSAVNFAISRCTLRLV